MTYNMGTIARAFGMLGAALVWWLLWNHALASLFHAGTLTYWQTFGLMFAMNTAAFFLRAILHKKP